MNSEHRYKIEADDFRVRLFGWSLARAGKTIHACELFYYTFEYTLEQSRDYVRYLSGLENYTSEDQKRDKELGYL
jgi:hypothetical protein